MPQEAQQAAAVIPIHDRRLIPIHYGSRGRELQPYKPAFSIPCGRDVRDCVRVPGGPTLPPVTRALLLDAAGTLIEPAEAVADVYARTAAGLGFPIAPAAVSEAFGSVFAGSGDPKWEAFPDGDAAERDWWARVVEATFRKASGVALPRGFIGPCFEILFSHYADPAAWRVFPEVPGILISAREAGFRLAVVSNFDRRLHGILAGHGLSFDAVVTSADASCRKPDPRIFRLALAALGVPAAAACHAGDSRAADLDGARGCGLGAFLLERPGSDLRDFFRAALESRGK